MNVGLIIIVWKLQKAVLQLSVPHLEVYEKGKVIHVQAYSGPEGSGMLRLLDLMKWAH
jgi:hypothetical protein